MAMPKAKLKKMTIIELAGVGAGAQGVQGTVILKRKEEGDKPPSSIAKKSLLTTAVAGHTHLIWGVDDSMAGSTSSEKLFDPNVVVVSGYTGYDNYGSYHSHPWVKNDDGTIVIGEVMGHTHEPLLVAVPVEDPVEKAKAAKSGVSKSTPNQVVHTVKSQEQSTMTTEIEKQLAELTKRNTQLEKLATLTDAQRAHHASLTGAEAEGFLAKSATERAAVIADIEKANEVVYTSTSDSTVYRKSDDKRLVEMAKRQDAQTAELTKARVERDTEILKTRVRAEIGHLPGSEDAKVALLKAVGGIADEKVREEVVTALKGADAFAKSASVAKGINPGASPVLEVPLEKFNAALAVFAKAKNKTLIEATPDFVETEEGQTLYDELIAAQN